jgi:hypothetical protein
MPISVYITIWPTTIRFNATCNSIDDLVNDFMSIQCFAYTIIMAYYVVKHLRTNEIHDPRLPKILTKIHVYLAVFLSIEWRVGAFFHPTGGLVVTAFVLLIAMVVVESYYVELCRDQSEMTYLSRRRAWNGMRMSRQEVESLSVRPSATLVTNAESGRVFL